MPAPKKGTVSAATREKAAKDTATGRRPKKAVSRKRSRAAHEALEGEGHAAGSHLALSRHAHAAAKKRTAADRSAAAKKGARTMVAHRGD